MNMGHEALGPPPPVGTRVTIRLNGWKIGGDHSVIGDIPGTVVGYRVDAGWLMVCVEPDFRPLWHKREMPDRRVCVFAGCDLTLRTPAEEYP